MFNQFCAYGVIDFQILAAYIYIYNLQFIILENTFCIVHVSCYKETAVAYYN
jgi:hypothetical protein